MGLRLYQDKRKKINIKQAKSQECVMNARLFMILTSWHCYSAVIYIIALMNIKSNLQKVPDSDLKLIDYRELWQ
jgi:hypothetical protein